MPRSRLGPLAIESKLGDHPSQSTVWRAIHVPLQRAVAVRIYSSPFGGTPEARAEFAREWERLKQIVHPAIVRCYGGGFEESDAYLAHELIEGETLAAQLERRTRLPWESVLDLAEPMADALKYLHAHEISYGCIRPEKILIAGLSPVLVDVRTNRRSPYRSTRPPTAQDFALMAPELLDDPLAATPRSDLYCLGATFYLALTGRPPADGETIDEVKANVRDTKPAAPASIVLECPVWLDKLLLQLLEKEPSVRPPSAEAVTLALAEVRRRSMSRAGVAEHVSSGFSPLNVTDQKQRDEARLLLGQGAIEFDEETTRDEVPWHERPLVLISGLLCFAALFLYFIWPLNEDQMRERAEDLLTENTRNAMNQAKISYLKPMLEKFPEGEHARWASEQLARVEMLQAEHALQVKQNRNLPLSNEGERLYAEANEFERFGDTAAALDRYRSMETLLGGDPEYRPYVDLARRQIAKIESSGVEEGEAARIIQEKLAEAERLFESGKVVAARKIWYSMVELYGNNQNVAPLVARAQERLESLSLTEKEKRP